jgi:hypothetical protein
MQAAKNLIYPEKILLLDFKQRRVSPLFVLSTTGSPDKD